MKNHIKVNGRLLQNNKRFSQLTERQKNWIVPELYNLYHNKMKELRTTGKLPPKYRDEVISALYDKIRDKNIWIPYGEVKKYTFSKTAKMVKSFKKHFPVLSEEIEAERAARKQNRNNETEKNKNCIGK